MRIQDKTHLFAKTIYGKLTLAALFTIPLYLTWHRVWLIAPCLVFGMSLVKKNRTIILLVVGLLAAFFLNSLFNFRTFYYPEIELDLFSILIDKSSIGKNVSYISNFIGISLLFSSIYVYSKIKYRPPVIIFNIFIFGLLLFFVQITNNFEKTQIIFFSVIIIFMKCFWYFSYSLSSVSISDQRPIYKYLGAIAPIWTFGFVRSHAVPRGILEVIQTSSNDAQRLAEVQVKGIKLAYLAMSYKLIAIFSFHIFYGPPASVFENFNFIIPQLNLTYPLKVGLFNYNQMPITILEKWFYVLFRPAYYILYEMAGNAGLLISFVNLLGFDIQKSVTNPHLATSFHDFFNRIYFYYNSIIVQFFFIPIYEALFKLKMSKQKRLFISTFLSIIIGGFTITYIRGTHYVVEYGFYDSLVFVFGRSIYLIGLGIFISISVIYSKNLSSIKLFQPTRVAIIYLIYALLHVSQGNLTIDTFEDRFRFLFSLFGINY